MVARERQRAKGEARLNEVFAGAAVNVCIPQLSKKTRRSMHTRRQGSGCERLPTNDARTRMHVTLRYHLQKAIPSKFESDLVAGTRAIGVSARARVFVFGPTHQIPPPQKPCLCSDFHPIFRPRKKAFVRTQLACRRSLVFATQGTENKSAWCM